MSVIYISFHLLASRTRNDTIELIRLYGKIYCYGGLFMFWKLHFTVQYNFKIKISSNVLTKLRSENFWKLRTTIIKIPMGLQLIICHKKELLSSLFCKTRAKIRNKCYQCKLVWTGTMNEYCKK